MAPRRARILDEVDRRIILRLQQDGRESIVGVARRLRVSEGTVRRRIKRLLEGDFVRVVAVPNPWMVGFDAVTLIGLRVDLDKIDQAAEKLASMREVHFVAVTTGSYDIFIWVMVPSAEDLGSFIKTQLARVPGVVRSESFINLEIKKSTFSGVT